MVTIFSDVQLRPFNTMGLSAVAGRVIAFSEADDLPEVDRLLNGETPVILGGGSNTLFTNNRVERTVVRPFPDEIKFFKRDESMVEVTVGSGVVLDNLIYQSCKQNLWGLENLSGIPGDIGGAAVQNVGAYGAEFADSVISVEAYDLTLHEKVVLTHPELHYGYRHSVFKEYPGRFVVTRVNLRLSSVPRPVLHYRGLKESIVTEGETLTPLSVRMAVLSIRDAKLPKPEQTGSVGSYFVNPVLSEDKAAKFHTEWPEAPAYIQPGGRVKLSAAWLIDKAGCKGMKVGGAGLWAAQPLVLVNATGSATAEDILSLESCIKAKVQEKFGVELVCEVVKV